MKHAGERGEGSEMHPGERGEGSEMHPAKVISSDSPSNALSEYHKVLLACAKLEQEYEERL